MSIIQNYIDQGFSIIPLKAKSKQPKHTKWNITQFTESDFSEGDNIGVKLGEPSGGILDTDIDNPKLLKIAGNFLLKTGMIFGHESNPDSHHIYKCADKWKTKQFAFEGKMYAEIRGSGSYTVFPDSIHEGTGEVITFSSIGKPSLVTYSDLEKSVALMCAAGLLAEVWIEGSRHYTTMDLAGVLAKHGISLEDCESLIEAVCDLSGDEDLMGRLKAVNDTYDKLHGDYAVTGIPSLEQKIGTDRCKTLLKWLNITNAASSQATNNADDSRLTELKDQTKFSDMECSVRFAAQAGADIAYLKEKNGWLLYDGAIWAQAHDEEIQAKVGVFLRNELAEEVKQNGIYKAIKSDAKSLQSRAKFQNISALAKAELMVSINDYDTDGFLLNVQNGTIDLKTGKLSSHNPSHKLTMVSPVVYDAKAICPKWIKFIDEAMEGDKEMTAYLKIMTGYFLTGSTQEQKLFMAYGKGGNGKSLFVNIIQKLLGEHYSKEMDINSLMVKKHEPIREDLARLKGIRFVSARESTVGQRFDEGLVKGLTGGDKVTCRFMRQDSFEYKPLFKIMITTNNLPNIIGKDEGIWRRMNVIPFNAKPQTMDKELEYKLAQELPAILNWAIDGCLEWQKSGLPLPQKVKEYSEKYRKDMDQVARFLEEECFTDKKSFTSSKSLYFSYKKWSEDNGEYQMTSTQLGSELKRKDFEYKRDTKGKREWGFNGLKLNECYMHDDSLPYGAMAQNAEGAKDSAPF